MNYQMKSNMIRPVVAAALLMMIISASAGIITAQKSKEFPLNFAETADKLVKSVVSIEATKIVKTKTMSRFHFFNDEGRELPDEIPSIGGGSGFVIGKDGYILQSLVLSLYSIFF